MPRHRAGRQAQDTFARLQRRYVEREKNESQGKKEKKKEKKKLTQIR